MRTAVLIAARKFEVREVPMPGIGPEDALIRVSRSGICSTDMHTSNGHYAGPICNLLVQMMRLVGSAPIIVAHLSAGRCAAVTAAGADAAISGPSTLRDRVLALTAGRGADLVIESVGSARLYATAFDLIRKGGHGAFFGLTGLGETVSVDILCTVLEENSLKGSVAGMGEDMHDAQTLLTHGRFRTESFTGAEFPLDQIVKAFRSLAIRPGDLQTQLVI